MNMPELISAKDAAVMAAQYVGKKAKKNTWRSLVTRAHVMNIPIHYPLKAPCFAVVDLPRLFRAH